MLEIFQKIIGILVADSTLTAMVPVGNIFVGAADVVVEKQADLLSPSIILTQTSEAVRTVPLGVRDTVVQLDIWSRNSQLELETIYERVLTLLDFQSGSKNSAHVFWERLGGAVDLFETDRRIFHRSCTFIIWSIK